jgi:hypothetical protein
MSRRLGIGSRRALQIVVILRRASARPRAFHVLDARVEMGRAWSEHPAPTKTRDLPRGRVIVWCDRHARAEMPRPPRASAVQLADGLPGATDWRNGAVVGCSPEADALVVSAVAGPAACGRSSRAGLR